MHVLSAANLRDWISCLNLLYALRSMVLNREKDKGERVAKVKLKNNQWLRFDHMWLVIHIKCIQSDVQGKRCKRFSVTVNHMTRECAWGQKGTRKDCKTAYCRPACPGVLLLCCPHPITLSTSGRSSISSVMCLCERARVGATVGRWGREDLLLSHIWKCQIKCGVQD